MSYIDLLFGSINFAEGSNEEISEYLFRLLYNVIMNFVIAVFYSFFSYTYNLIFLVYSFSTGPNGLIFFSIAFISGVSLLSLFLWGLFLAGRAPVTFALENQEANPRRNRTNARRT